MEAGKWLRFRIVTLLLFFLVLFIALISRALQLQVLSSKTLKAMAEKQHVVALSLPPERGIIFDRNGEKLAASIMADSVCADPSKVKNPDEIAGKVASLLHIDKDTVLQKLIHYKNKNFCFLARKIPPDQVATAEYLLKNIDGIFLVKEPKRFYPNGELAGHLIGFVGVDSDGLEGLEQGYDRHLKGIPEKLIWARDAKGKKLYPRVEKSVCTEDESYHLVLTIDSRIQYVVESQLREAVRTKGAKGASAIVMDPRTGEILALANEPAFDPNNYNPEKWKNRTISDCFDPGSIFKPFLAAGALEEGVVRETDRFYCENGRYLVGGRIIHEANRKKYNILSFHDIIKYSSNIGFVKVSERLGKEKFYQYIKRFGFGSKTGIDLPGESAGLLRPSERWRRVDAATIAFGQGISVTAIQLITALSAIANDGVLMKPYVVRGLVDKKGQIVKMNRPTVVRRVISSATAKRLTAMLTDVVGDDDGTGKNARIINVSVAGKTGTSQKFDFARGVYSSEKVRTSFMGFFPAEDPQVAILVTLDEPQRGKWGGVAAAPVFKNIGEQMVTCFKTNIRGVSPSFPILEEERINGRFELVSTPAMMTDDAVGETAGDESVVPDFRGMTIREALKKARERDVELNVRGNGWAVNQEPPPGVSIRDHRSCTVSFSAGD
ncbi:MAG: penicillin-binding transpeptidase domain-containing protein [Syntrophales bacterium]|nr:penicillin-binding transpeptidase domain-containing protein [Syntrophales bacterium]